MGPKFFDDRSRKRKYSRKVTLVLWRCIRYQMNRYPVKVSWPWYRRSKLLPIQKKLLLQNIANPKKCRSKISPIQNIAVSNYRRSKTSWYNCLHVFWVSVKQGIQVYVTVYFFNYLCYCLCQINEIKRNTFNTINTKEYML